MKKLNLKTSYSQRDPAWKDVLLGFNTSKYTIGTDGCLITAITNYLNAIGKNETPKTLNEKIKGVRGFVNGGWFVWESLNKIFPDVKLAYTSPRFDGVDTPPAFFDSMKEKIDDGYALLLEIDFNPSQVGEQMHWVLVHGYEDGEFLIADPWSGEKTVLSVYGKPENITFMFRTYSPTLEEESDNTCTTKLRKAKKDIEFLEGELNKKGDVISDLEGKIETKDKVIEDAISRANDFETKLKEANILLDRKKIENETLYQDNQDLKDNIKDVLKPEIKRLTNQKFNAGESLGFLITAIQEKRWK